MFYSKIILYYDKILIYMKNLSDFKPFYLYISKSTSILGDKLAEFRKIFKGQN